MKGQRVLVDTMVVIEAHRIGCWAGLVGYFSIETVECCAIESATGYRRREGYVAIDQELLRSQIRIHGVTAEMRAALYDADPLSARLDPGERDLLSFATIQSDALLLCAPDKAAINCTFRVNLLDKLVALEELATEAGIRKQGYRENHTRQWLTAYKTKVILGIL
jgi:hypothetical protein